jgi:hypothetical protein
MYSKGKQKWRKLYKDLESMNRELDIQQSIDDAKAAAVRYFNVIIFFASFSNFQDD